MKTHSRIKFATKAAGIHLLCGLGLAAVVAMLMFFVWYPYPYNKISGGIFLFALLASVDVVCGPLLTLILFDPNKSNKKLLIDFSLIIFLQISAFAYGFHSIALSRPVWMVFEEDRFRVVSASDVHKDELSKAAKPFNELSFSGPRLAAISRLDRSSPEFLESVQKNLAGDPPSFRPSRVVGYESRQNDVIKAMWSLSYLSKKSGYADLLLFLEKKYHTSIDPEGRKFGYLPLVQAGVQDWIVVIDGDSEQPIEYWHIDGW